MDIIFVSDGVVELATKEVLEFLGGAEFYDDVCIKELRTRGHNIKPCLSRDVTLELVQNTEAFFIISNFIQLKPEVIEALQEKRYIIIEHDHKYCLMRNVSDFKDFISPAKYLINIPFYENAIAVCTQTKLHTEVVAKNLPSTCNVVNMGGSLWSEDNLAILEKYSTIEKEVDYGVMHSDNPIKNTARSIKHCEENNLEHRVVGSPQFEKFVDQLSRCRKFIFFPTVLETCCRVVVEARMLNCGIVTNGLIGAASEEWFKLKGQELIDFTRSNNKVIVDKIEGFLDAESIANKGREITVILNAYRRTHLLKEQIERLRSQTIKPKQIWVWVNHHEDAADYDFSACGADRVLLNDHNWKFYGRFAAALLADTEYIAMFDDDTMPGKNWLQNCLQTMKVKEGILGGIGVLLQGEKYDNHTREGWATHNEEIVEVDLVGHAWFFKREWLSHLWREKPVTWENAEDIQFAYLAQKYGNISSFVPPHPASDPTKSSSLKGYELGVDSKATSTPENHHLFYPQRDLVIKNALENGWKLLKDR